MKLAKTFDLNTVTTPDEIPSPIDSTFRKRFNPLKMSSYVTQEWESPTEEDQSLATRFFGSDITSMASYHEQNTILSYIPLISGFLHFNFFGWIDLAIRKMAAEGLPLTLPVLTMNMRAAIRSKDIVKARWTWNEIVDLPHHLGKTPEFDRAGNRINRCFLTTKYMKKQLQQLELLRTMK